MDIHNYKRSFERTIQRISDSTEISQENKDIMFGFKDNMLSEGIGIAKINRYLGDLIKFNGMLSISFDKAKKEDIKRVIADLNQTDLSEETKRCFKIMLRKLYRFIKDIDTEGIYPEEVAWMSLKINRNHQKLPEELLNDKETESIVRCCGSVRDKALIASLAESGCRVSEIALMKIKHISFEELGARLTVQGKTGTRKILVINSVPYLQEWINQHPFNDNPNEYVWYNPRNELLSYARIATILKRAAKKAGIKKRVHLHLLRHSRATALASIMSDSQMKNYLGWSQSSRMSAVYVHMSGKDTDEAVLRANGLQIKREETESRLKPLNCLRCKTVNSATNKCCKMCGFILDINEGKEILKQEMDKQDMNKLMNKLTQNKEVLEFLVKKMDEMKNANV